MGSEDDSGDLGAGEWRRHWRLRGWGVRLTLETEQVGSEVVSGERGAGEWRRYWRLSIGGLET